MRKFPILLLLVTMHSAARAGEADVLDVAVSCNSNSICRFDVTVKHDDDGWKHYANRWEVLAPDGRLLATRKLAHPHNEQPFTRSLGNVKIPSDVAEVIVRAHDLIHEYGGKEVVVRLAFEAQSMNAIQLKEFGSKYAAAWSSQDPAALAALYPENGSLTVNAGGTGNTVDINGYEEWIFDADGLIAQSLGHYDEAEFKRQLHAGEED